MAKSRDELRRELQASLGLGAPKESKTERTAEDSTSNGNPFSKLRKTARSTAVAVAEPEDESEDEQVDEVAEDNGDEPDATPVEDFVDAVTGLVDYIADNRTALKEFLLRLR